MERSPIYTNYNSTSAVDINYASVQRNYSQRSQFVGESKSDQSAWGIPGQEGSQQWSVGEGASRLLVYLQKQQQTGTSGCKNMKYI